MVLANPSMAGGQRGGGQCQVEGILSPQAHPLTLSYNWTQLRITSPSRGARSTQAESLPLLTYLGRPQTLPTTSGGTTSALALTHLDQHPKMHACEFCCP